MPIQSLNYVPSRTLLTVIRDFSTGSERIWRIDTSVFEVYSSANIVHYGVSTPSSGSPDSYRWTIPAGLPNLSSPNEYEATTYDVTGTSLAVEFASADGPTGIWLVYFGWNGTSFVEYSTADLQTIRGQAVTASNPFSFDGLNGSVLQVANISSGSTVVRANDRNGAAIFTGTTPVLISVGTGTGQLNISNGAIVTSNPYVINEIVNPTFGNFTQVIPTTAADLDSPVIDLQVGIAATRDFFMLGDQNHPEDLTGVTEVVFTMKESITDSIAVLQKTSLSGSSLTINTAESKFTLSLTADDTSSLFPGSYIADLTAEIGGIWYNSATVEVRVSSPIGKVNS